MAATIARSACVSSSQPARLACIGPPLPLSRRRRASSGPRRRPFPGGSRSPPRPHCAHAAMPRAARSCMVLSAEGASVPSPITRAHDSTGSRFRPAVFRRTTPAACLRRRSRVRRRARRCRWHATHPSTRSGIVIGGRRPSPTASRPPPRARSGGVRLLPLRPRRPGGPPRLRRAAAPRHGAAPRLRRSITTRCPSSAPHCSMYPNVCFTPHSTVRARLLRSVSRNTLHSTTNRSHRSEGCPASRGHSTSRSVRPRPNPYSRSMRPPLFTTRCRYDCKMSCGAASRYAPSWASQCSACSPKKVLNAVSSFVMFSRPSSSAYHLVWRSRLLCRT